jgi:hypothetical protein
MEWLYNKFHKLGIEKKNIPSAIVEFKILGYLTWLGMFVGCYKFRPVQNFFKLSGPRSFLDGVKMRHGQRYDIWHKWVLSKSDKLANWPYFKPIPTSLGMKPKRVVYALAETTLLYKLMLPILFPTYMVVISLHYKNGTDSTTKK